MKKIIGIIFIILITIFGVCIGFSLSKTSLEDDIEEIDNEDFSWQANYIWVDETGTSQEDNVNKWVCFRKEFTIDDLSKCKNSIARIAADSKYYLYVNGSLVVLDGGLKRNLRDSIYYDSIKLDDYLVQGKNTIAVLVWHFRKDSDFHILIQDKEHFCFSLI